jgi:hypothetical protein
MLGFEMNKEEYNKILCDHQAKIEYLNEEMNDFKQTNLPVVKEHIKQQKQLHREWFLEHFDKIWKNRHKFKLGTPYASVIVDGIIITSFACPYYGYVVDKISIGNLIKLWDNSFMFRGYPLIHYRRHHNSDYSCISYIKDRKVISYDYSCRQLPEEQYIPSRLVLQILKNLRCYQPDDLDNYRTVEELAEELF